MLVLDRTGKLDPGTGDVLPPGSIAGMSSSLNARVKRNASERMMSHNETSKAVFHGPRQRDAGEIRTSHKMRRLAMLLLGAAMSLTIGAHGQVRPGAPAIGPLDYAPVTLQVACGELFKVPCAKVLPKIAARTAPAGLDLRPMESGGALDTAAAVCQGQAAAAIVPRDVAAQIARQPSCLNRYDVVGRPLYPYYALLVVRADASFRSLDDPASDFHRWRIATGAEGSGGQIAFGFLLGSSPLWQRDVAVTADDAATALQRIADGSIDGFFTVETLDSDLVDRVRLTSDTRGKPLYRFVDIRPGKDFSRIGDGAGHCVYRMTALDFGGRSPVTTVSEDAVMLLGRGFRDAHARSGPRAADALASAIDAAQAAILGDTKSLGGWRPTTTSCQ